MCGIAGIVDFRHRPEVRDADRMVRLLSHRGPDHQAVWEDRAVVLGHCRLSILDLSPVGHQPMRSADGRYVICYNGEIYNFEELRKELISSGESFRSRSDTEVVLQWFARHGREGLRRLNGIFAFAIWDLHSCELTLVRDRFGVKPLYYRLLPGGGLVFGSEIKAILGSGAGVGEIDWLALHEFVHYGVGGLGERTLFREVKKLESGHVLVCSAAGSEIIPYWQLVDVAQEDDGRRPVLRVAELLEGAVKRQLVSDVPVGVFLSGGIDSSAVTAFAARHYRGKLSTYAVGFDFGGESNELPKAAKVAKHFNTDHHELFIRGVDLPEVIEALVGSHDLPFSDAANIPLFLLCRELRGAIKVVLQGDGGDEVFGGYRRYSLLSQASWLRFVSRFSPVLRVFPLGRVRGRRLRRMADIWREADPAVRMALLMAQDERSPSPLRVLGPAARALTEREDSFVRYREFGRRFAGLEPVQQMLWTDMQVLLPDIFCEKVDRATMAWGVEARVPFLDYDLTDYVLPLPAAVKMPGGRPKGLLKAALRGMVPDFVLDAPKMGFAVPYGRWLAGPLADYARGRICEGAAARDGLIDPLVTANLLAEHCARRDDHGFLLWKTLNLALWYERYRPSMGTAP